MNVSTIAVQVIEFKDMDRMAAILPSIAVVICAAGCTFRHSSPPSPAQVVSKMEDRELEPRPADGTSVLAEDSQTLWDMGVRAKPVVMLGLSSPDATVRRACAATAAKLRMTGAVPLLWKRFRTDRRDLRLGYLGAIEWIDPEQAKRLVAGLANDRASGELQVCVLTFVQSLGSRGPEGILPGLISALVSGEDAHRRMGAERTAFDVGGERMRSLLVARRNRVKRALCQRIRPAETTSLSEESDLLRRYILLLDEQPGRKMLDHPSRAERRRTTAVLSKPLR